MGNNKNKPTDQDDRWHQALARARLGVWDIDLQTGHCVYSTTWKRMLGYADHELADDDDLWLKLVHPDDREQAIASGDRHLAGETPDIETEFRMRHKDGNWIWINDRGGVVERAEDGTPIRMLGVQADISRQKKSEHDLAQLNERLRLALDASGVGIWQFEPRTGDLYWDDRMRDIFGLSRDGSAIQRETWHEHLHPEDKEEIETATYAGMDMAGVTELRYRILRSDGEIRHVESLSKYVTDTKFADRLVGVIRDITEEVQAAEALAREKERLRVTLQSISDAVISTDTAGFIDFVNGSAGRLLDCPRADLIGRKIDEVFDFGPAKCLCEPAMRDPHVWNGDCRDRLWEFEDRNGVQRAWRCASSPISGSDGATLGMVYTFQDMTSDYARQRELAYAARHDALTGLLNRAAFDAELAAWVENASGRPFALLYIDLDHFKALNDFAGHAAGDAALRKIAGCIGAALPPESPVARLGGDEFAAIVPAASALEAERLGGLVFEAINSATLEHNVADRKLGASIGLHLVLDDRLDSTDVLALADDACYEAKSGGRNRYILNSTETHKGLAAIRIVSEVTDAMEEGRLKLFGQQIRDMECPWAPTRRIEVLARLLDRDGKMVPPCEFIPATERFSMARTLDRWIIKNVLQRFGDIMSGDDGYTFGFNLSAQTLSDPGLWDFVATMIAETGADPGHMVFEITETTAVTNFQAAETFVHAARRTGCRVSLDDFGAGLSSFAYLRRFPIDTLKIDGNFITNIAENKFDRAIVSSITALARDLGFGVIAEKIEDPASIRVLQGLGVRLGQGFLLHQPEALTDIVEAGRQTRRAGVA